MTSRTFLVLAAVVAVAAAPTGARAQCCGPSDLGDGTIKDTCSGRQWEKKDGDDGVQNPANPHDVDNRYSWAGCCSGTSCLLEFNRCQPNAAAAATCAAYTDGGTGGCSTCTSGTCVVDGITTVWDWLSQVNAANFAGHNDWRLPSEGSHNSPATGSNELETILLAPYPCGTDPCINSIFGPTYPFWYWSASTSGGSHSKSAWWVSFLSGDVAIDDKTSQLTVRAVRGGPSTTRFVDNGDGTIWDKRTALQWEKKDGAGGVQNPANPHDVDNRYSWAGCCGGTCTGTNYCQPNAAAAASCALYSDGGTQGCSTCPSGGPGCYVDPHHVGAIATVWDWLNQLNAANFAGHNDWRLPSQGHQNSPATGSNQLETILLAPYPCGTSPCIGSIFGPTASDLYWSASTSAFMPEGEPTAWLVNFLNGHNRTISARWNPWRVRAVR